MFSNITISRKIEISMISNINRCCFICFCIIDARKIIIIIKKICNCKFYISRKALFTIRRSSCKTNTTKLSVINNLSLPHHFIIRIKAAMKTVWTIILVEIIFFSIKFEGSFSDSICKAAYNSTKKHSAIYKSI